MGYEDLIKMKYLIKLIIPVCSEVYVVSSKKKDINELKKNFKIKGSKLLITEL